MALSKVEPLSDVTVCAIESLFVHFTVVPTFTVSVAGKDFPVILTVLPVTPPGVDGGLDESFLEHENAKIINNPQRAGITDFFVNMLSSWMIRKLLPNCIGIINQPVARIKNVADDV